jgi:hypothetical protein
MMWIVGALIIFGGGYWDAADCIMLRNAKYNECVDVQRSDKNIWEYSPCKEGKDSQVWLWEGKKLKNKWTGTCIRVRKDYDFGPYICSLPANTKEDKRRSINELMEWTRFGEHGLKTSTGKCLKFASNGLRYGNCTEDQDDPFYE